MRPPPDDDDPAGDWPDADPTILDGAFLEPVADPVTAPHDLAALAASPEAAPERSLDARFAAVYAEGQEDTLGALRSVLLERGLTNEETAHLVLLVRSRQTAL